jgi:hypothetical protein
MTVLVAHCLPLTSLKRERTLPFKGRVTAHLEQKVNTLDVVAEARRGEQHTLIDVAGQLGIKPAEAQKLIQVRAGETITRGQLIAQRRGMGSASLHASSDGRVVLVGDGRILVETASGSLLVQAGMPGRVTRLFSERGVEITFTGAYIQGTWGNGQVNAGLLVPLVSSPDESMEADRLDMSLRGSVLLGGGCREAAVLKAAAEIPVRGMILGSLAAGLLPMAAKLDFPVVVVDGFGLNKMDGTCFKLLYTNERREVTLNAQAMNAFTNQRPEIFIPLPVTIEPPAARPLEQFDQGQVVRVTRSPHAGMAGTVERLLPGLALLPGGLRAAAAEVKLESGEQVTVPLANLEVLG